MIRKIVPQGPASLGISIPKQWAKRFSLKKGDEIELSEQGNKILISTDKILNTESIDLDSKDTEIILSRILSGYYRSGADEINILYSKNTIPPIITKFLNEQTVGFEIIKQTQTKITIKDLSKNKFDDFDDLFRRCLYLLKNMLDLVTASIRKKDKNALENIYQADRKINKFTAYAARTLIKSSSKSSKFIAFFYNMLRSIEETGDTIRNLGLYYKDNPTEISKQALKELESINSTLRKLCNNFYKKELDKKEIVNIVLNIKQSRENIDKIFKTEQPILLFHIKSIVEKTHDLVMSLIETIHVNSFSHKQI